jgi:small subunit ribosomal protein S4
MSDSQCKICRRMGVKLFLKGERCFTQKCQMVKKPYPPGKKGKRRPIPLSEYGRELKEKQKLKNLYNLKETQFKNYFKEVLKKRGKVENASELIVKILESRLDNVVFRLGFTSSRKQARQLVSHGYFLVNGKATNIPSRQLKKGDTISIKPQKYKKAVFKDIKTIVKKIKTPNWLEFNVEKLEGKLKSDPALEDIIVPVEISSIFEFYSR